MFILSNNEWLSKWPKYINFITCLKYKFRFLKAKVCFCINLSSDHPQDFHVDKLMTEKVTAATRTETKTKSKTNKTILLLLFKSTISTAIIVCKALFFLLFLMNNNNDFFRLKIQLKKKITNDGCRIKQIYVGLGLGICCLIDYWHYLVWI